MINRDKEPERGTVVARVNSTSNPSKFYNVMRSQEGYLYCDCAAWRFQKAPVRSRYCKHTRAFEGQTPKAPAPPKAPVRESAQAQARAKGNAKILATSTDRLRMVAEAQAGAFMLMRAACPTSMSNSDVGTLANKLTVALIEPLINRVKRLEDEARYGDVTGEPVRRKPASSKSSTKPSAPAKAVRLITLNDDDE